MKEIVISQMRRLTNDEIEKLTNQYIHQDWPDGYAFIEGDDWDELDLPEQAKCVAQPINVIVSKTIDIERYCADHHIKMEDIKTVGYHSSVSIILKNNVCINVPMEEVEPYQKNIIRPVYVWAENTVFKMKNEDSDAAYDLYRMMTDIHDALIMEELANMPIPVSYKQVETQFILTKEENYILNRFFEKNEECFEFVLDKEALRNNNGCLIYSVDYR